MLAALAASAALRAAPALAVAFAGVHFAAATFSAAAVHAADAAEGTVVAVLSLLRNLLAFHVLFGLEET